MAASRIAGWVIAALAVVLIVDLAVLGWLYGRAEPAAERPSETSAPAREDDPESHYLAEQAAAGWVAVGRFGRHWPASPVREIEDDDGIRFKRANGTPHHYKGFEGYRMRVVFLRAENGEETIVVFRSQRKRLPSTPALERE